MAGDVDEVLLLSLQLDRLFHFARLNALGPLLLRDVSDTAEDALKSALVIPFRIAREQDPSLASVTTAVLPGRLESEFEADWLCIND